MRARCSVRWAAYAKSLKALQEALGGTVKDTSGKLDETIDKNQNVGSTTVNQVKEAHSAYVQKTARPSIRICWS